MARTSMAGVITRSPDAPVAEQFVVAVVEGLDHRREWQRELFAEAGYRVVVASDLPGQEVDLVLVTTPAERERFEAVCAAAVYSVAAAERTAVGTRQELLLRVAVLCRRGRAQRQHVASVRRSLALDPTAHTVEGPQGREALTPAEYRLLRALLAGRGRVVRRGELTRATWARWRTSANSLDSCIRCLRTKIGSLRAPVELSTVRGHGYRLTV